MVEIQDYVSYSTWAELGLGARARCRISQYLLILKLTTIPVQRGSPKGNTCKKLVVTASVPREVPTIHTPQKTNRGLRRKSREQRPKPILNN